MEICLTLVPNKLTNRTNKAILRSRVECYQVHFVTESSPPVNAQIMSTVKHCARSAATTLHVHVAWTQYGKTILYTTPSLLILDFSQRDF